MSVDWSKAPSGATHFLRNRKYPGEGDAWMEVIQGYQIRRWIIDPDGEPVLMENISHGSMRIHDVDMSLLTRRPNLIDHRMGSIDDDRSRVTREMFMVGLVRLHSAMLMNDDAPAVMGAMAEFLYDNGFRKQGRDQ